MVMAGKSEWESSYSLGSCAQVAHPADQIGSLRLAIPSLLG